MNISDKIYMATVLVAFFVAIFHYFVSLLQLAEQKHRNKYAALVDKLHVIDSVVYPISVSVANDPQITKSDAKQAVIAKSDAKLRSLGLDVSIETISRFAEAAYQRYKLNGGKSVSAFAPLADAFVDSVIDGNDSQALTPTPTSVASTTDASSVAASAINSYLAEHRSEGAGK